MGNWPSETFAGGFSSNQLLIWIDGYLRAESVQLGVRERCPRAIRFVEWCTDLVSQLEAIR